MREHPLQARTAAGARRDEALRRKGVARAARQLLERESPRGDVGRGALEDGAREGRELRRALLLAPRRLLDCAQARREVGELAEAQRRERERREELVAEGGRPRLERVEDTPGSKWAGRERSSPRRMRSP